MRGNKGFTLIELLVVIAIIGILSGIVLVSLNSARNKARDARVISNVQQARVMLESSFTGTAYTLFTGTATVPQTSSTDTNFNQLFTDATNNSGKLLIYGSSTSATTYAIYGQLPSAPTTYFCIDSVGSTSAAKAYSTATTSGC